MKTQPTTLSRETPVSGMSDRFFGSWFFMLTYIPIALVSPFKKKVEWKHIDHSRSVTLDEIKSEGGEKLDVPSVRIKIAPKAEDNNKQF